MGVIATVPIIPGTAVNHKRSYASYPQSSRLIKDRYYVFSSLLKRL